MSNSKLMLGAAFVAAGTLGAWGIHELDAQQEKPPFTRTVLQSPDLSLQGRAAVVARVDFLPGATIGKHTHPGEELGYVLEGTLTLEVEGRPSVTLNAGEVFFVEAGRVHAGKNGNTPGKVLATYIVEKGKPLAMPAP
ncbi:MAG TPA: cupin domain-containing protein [Burkholderiales bacterium]|nr:cupin domain-containing protein [Burkholderiales bacterium]